MVGGGVAEVKRDGEKGEEGGEESGPKLVPPPTEDVIKPVYNRNEQWTSPIINNQISLQ